MLNLYLELFVLGIVAAWIATPQVMRVCHRFRIYGHSRDGRERATVPCLGGLGIFIAVVSAGLLLRFVLQAQVQVSLRWSTLINLFLPASLVMLLGIYDDVAGASPWQKLWIEFLAAGVVWWSGIRIVALPVLGYPIHSRVLSFLLTVFWMLAVTNAFNLVDGLDGLAAGVALFVALSMFIVASIQGDSAVCVIAIAVAGALLGFLRFNSAPAKIFLGDTGSLFLGFLLGTLAVSTSEKSTTLLAVAVPYLAFGVPLLDTSLAIVRRFLSGRPLFGGDCEHLHHKLLEMWSSPRMAVAALYGLAALFSIGSLLIVRSLQSLLVLVIVLGGVTGWFLTKRVRYEEIIEFGAYLRRALRWQRRVVANQILMRKASRKLEAANDMCESWSMLTDALSALDFDEAELLIEDWLGDDLPDLPLWRRAESGFTGHAWSASIPLRAGGLIIAVLQLRRSLEKGRMLFQFSSVLDTLIPPFEERLRREYEAWLQSHCANDEAQAGPQPEDSRLKTVEENHETVATGHELTRVGG